MRCMNCGLPLSPERNLANCPRCGASLNAFQGAQQQQQSDQAGWGNMGGAPQQSSWGQTPPPGPFSPFTQQNQGGPTTPMNSGFNSEVGSGLQQSPLSPRRPYTPPPSGKSNPRLLFMAAGLCVLLAAMLLGLIYILGSSGSGNPSQTANTNSNTPASNTGTTPASASPTAVDTTTPTADASPTASGTAYPGQQYIDGAQMAEGVNKKTLQPTNPTTTFKVGAAMYVVFKLHPPSQGGAVCAYWYLNGNQVTPFAFAVKSTSHASYTYATYGSAGPAYVELYWASSTSCTDKVLAQHVDFTVTAS